MTISSLRPSEIRYSQDSIAYNFRYGRYSGVSIGQTLDDLLLGKCNVRDIPTITVSKRDGLWYSGDNRRLWVFRKCEELGILDTVPVKEGYIDSSKFTTYNRGVSIHVRGNPGGWIWTQRNRKDLVIKDPEPPKPVISPIHVELSIPVITNSSDSNSVVDLQAKKLITSPNLELSDDLTDISDSDTAIGPELSQNRHSSGESDSYSQNISVVLKDSRTEGQVNPPFVGDENYPSQKSEPRINTLTSYDEITSGTTPEVLTCIDNGKVDLSSLDEESSSRHQRDLDQHSINIEADPDLSTVTTEPKDTAADVELGQTARGPYQQGLSQNIAAFFLKYRCQCLVLLMILLVIVSLVICLASLL